MKKILIYSATIILSLLSFVGCKDGESISTEDAFKGIWLYTGDYLVINGNNLSTNVTSTTLYTFENNNVLVITDSTSSTGYYSVQDGVISYTDKDGNVQAQEFKIQGDKLFIYETTTSTTGQTKKKGIILTKKSSLSISISSSSSNNSTGSGSGSGTGTGTGTGSGSGTGTNTQLIASWKTTKSYTIENGATSYSETTVPYTLTFKSDGTVSAVATGLNESGTYTVKDDVITTTMEGFETSYFRFVDGYLYFYQYYTDGGVQSEEGDILQKK